MLLEKPEDVKHDNLSGTVCAIYGVDAHPKLQIFATAGGDNAVKIWSLQAPLDGSISTFELLATLSNHQQAVNCVRWASHGRYLASGSDDQLVLLYELQVGAPAAVPFGSNARPNKQKWVRCSTLERHTMDVADVAWSPDDRMLATCSIDNTILIWDVGIGVISEVMTQPLQTLTGHNGWVKGVAWDPVGKVKHAFTDFVYQALKSNEGYMQYLSSAGEDKTVRMWKVADWQQSDVVTEPFEECASTSHFRRLSWSPDGSVLCATHAFSSKKNIASLLNRGSWTNDVKFVGHQGVVTSTRFNPKLLVSKADPDKEFACCAVGGEDATVSIWLAHLARPLAVIKDCFESSVTDLAWSSSQSLLLACSLDGSVCCFKFAHDEIGTPISDAQQSKLLQAKYGSRAGITLASTLVENPIQLQLEEKSTNTLELAVGVGESSSAALVIENKTNTLIPKKKNKVGAEEVNSTDTLQSVTPTIPSDKIQNNAVPPQFGAQFLATNPASSHNNIRNILGPAIMSPVAPDAAMLISRMALSLTGVNEASSVSGTNDVAALQVSPAPTQSNETELNPDETPSLVKTSEMQLQVSKMEARKNDSNSLKRKREKSDSALIQTATSIKSKEILTRHPKLINERRTDVAKKIHLLPDLPFRLQFSVKINTSAQCGAADSSIDYRAENWISQAVVEVNVHNLMNSNPGEIVELGPVYSTVKYSEGSEIKWIDRISGRIVCAVGNAKYCVVGVHNGDILIVNRSGRRLFPYIALGSAISVMECSVNESSYLLIILATGDLKIWNLAKRKLVLSTSIDPITNVTPEDLRKLTLLRCQVTKKGIPLLTFAESNLELKCSSNLTSYTFDIKMLAWYGLGFRNESDGGILIVNGICNRMRVADDDFVYSDFATTLPTDVVTVKSIPIGPLRRLQNASCYSRVQRGTASAILTGITDPLMQRNVTRSHLEHQVAAAIVLKSSAEYRYWIQAYVKFLTHDADVSRLDDLCAEMMGPFYAHSYNLIDGGDWDPLVLDLHKRGVLKLNILPTIAANRALQRVVTKYQLMLSEIEAREMVEDEINDKL
ncbi:uncharacterized protein CCR75_003423 [Bremia lactucae]|uniref:Protein HIRA n=1 Tax=Bremia lactucae TaxID=4779 RepID=A0A976IIC2_BRELC|nr:hypothetical protein CCR75_003423 [Bremia lactucae]